MRKLLVTLDDDLSKGLAKYPNQNEIVRSALRLYIEDITTPDTIHGLRKSYANLLKHQQTKFDYYDECFARMDKLIGELETRLG